MNANQTFLFNEETESTEKKTIKFGALVTGLLLLNATGEKDVIKALKNHSLTDLMNHLRKTLDSADPDKAKAEILSYLATDPEAEKKAKEEEKARKEAEKAKREAEKAERKAKREAELIAFFGNGNI